MLETLKILDINVNTVDYPQAISELKKFLNSTELKFIVTPNSEIVMNATKDEELRTIINSADLVIPDGIGLVYASRILKKPLKERVTGIDFLNGALEELSNSGKSIFLLGSKEGIAKKAGEEMQKKYPNLKIAGTHNGFFSEGEEEDIIELINRANADMLCVALGSPKQEMLIYKYKNKLNAKVAIGVGGSLDVWAGELKRAPIPFQKLGIEWLYRLIQEPKRYKRMGAIPKFMIKVMFNRK